MPKKIQSLSGMHDIFNSRYDYFEKIREVSSRVAKEYGFKGIEFPIMEETELFARGVGGVTDIVEKEMYTFKTKGGDFVALRPEGTASVMRAYIEHNFYTRPQPTKLFYFGPFFRYERPQAGRFRQFWQFGLEAIGKSCFVVDVQIIKVISNIFEELGIKTKIEVNNMGDLKCRKEFKTVLRRYLKKRSNLLCSDCKRRLKENPLRVLDCKQCIEVKSEAPQIIDHICKQCRSDFKNFLEFLEELDIPYNLNPFLVRGLDYYTGTVYEFFLETEDEERMAVGGGGRYDGLSKILGDEERPATGVAIGIERIILAMEKSGGDIIEKKIPDVFIAQLGDLAKKKALNLFEEMRNSKVDVAESFGQDSLKSQMNRADKLGAKITIIIGKEEAVEDRVILRDMNSGEQEKIKTEEVLKEVKGRLKKNKNKD